MQNSQKETFSLTLQFVLFILLVPVLYATSINLDTAWNMSMDIPFGIRALASVPIAAGLVLFMWTMRSLFMAGHHAPSSVTPPTTLVSDGPFAYTRNPHALAAGIWLLGFSIYFSSPSFFLMTVALFFIILYVMKFGEEVELEERFGDQYRAYKKSVPFLLPRMK